jgi:two-component system cell cycle sensor histidine kinase/response regulator CckA
MTPTSAAPIVSAGDCETSPLEPRYRDLFEGALLAIYVSHPDGRLLACNAAFARLLGFESVRDAVSACMAGVYDAPEDRERFLASLRERGRLEHHRTRLRRRNGDRVDVVETVVGEFDRAGLLTELHGFLIDVTASVEADLALGTGERQLRAAFADAADAMLILDDKRWIVDANPAACRLFDLDATAPTLRQFDELIAPGAAQRDDLGAVWREMRERGETTREHRVVSAAESRLFECTYRARVDAERHLCVVRDITERRLLEERLMEAEKIECVGRLAGGIAHDFNNLLTAILGYTELLLGGRGEGDPERADLEEIQRAGQRAATLTQQLLAFSRKQVLMPKDVDLNTSITALQGMLARAIREDVTLTCRLAPAAAVIRIDPTQLEQIVLNLVLNARDALPSGGHICLEVALVPRLQVEFPRDQSGAAEDYVRLRVIDNGVGISPAARPHLFEPFFTTKAVGKGTGLGLASVYGIVRQSHGFITVESEIGRGTVFTMHFPAVPAPVAEAPIERRARSEVEPRGQTVLLVEDDESVRRIISAVLHRQGFSVLEAASARHACELFDRHAYVDLLLTDVVMPAMNGTVLAQRLLGAQPDLRVLFISGHTDVMMAAATDHPNVSFLGKPFRASALSEQVRAILARPGSGARKAADLDVLHALTDACTNAQGDVGV